MIINSRFTLDTTNLHLKSFTIPRGRMRGDVDGDGLVTRSDGDTLLKMTVGQFPIPPKDTEDRYACDLNNDNILDIWDAQTTARLAVGQEKLGAYPEITGNWNNNPNYATEDAQFYTDILIEEITAASDVFIMIDPEDTLVRFIKAECIQRGVRLWVDSCPIKDLPCIVSWCDSGSGVVTVTQNQFSTVEELDNKIDSNVPLVTTVELFPEEWNTAKLQFVEEYKDFISDETTLLEITFKNDGSEEEYNSCGITYAVMSTGVMRFRATTIPSSTITIYITMQTIKSRYSAGTGTMPS